MGYSYSDFPNGVTSFGVPIVGGLNGIPFTGNWWFVDAVTGSDGNASAGTGASPQAPLKTIAQAYSLAAEGNNDVNAILSTSGGLPDGYMVWDYLTSLYGWYLTTNFAKDSLLMMNRVSFETDMQVDFTTDNLLVKGYERYVPTYNDWRAVYGSQPTS